MKKFTAFDATALVVWLLPAVYTAFIYSLLPARVPLHYDIHGDVDRYGSRTEFVFVIVLMAVVSAGVYLLMKYLPKIDPKKAVSYGEGTFQKLGLGVMVFVTALSLWIIFTTVHRGVPVDRVLLPLLGLMFAFLGNMMNSIKPNYFAGFRTPWALENPDNWRATHRLVSRLWFAGGILITILTLVLPPEPATIVMLCIIAVITIMPYAYSYSYFKKHHLNQQ
jgi:uncharacterized membrane protein